MYQGQNKKIKYMTCVGLESECPRSHSQSTKYKCAEATPESPYERFNHKMTLTITKKDCNTRLTGIAVVVQSRERSDWRGRSKIRSHVRALRVSSGQRERCTADLLPSRNDAHYSLSQPPLHLLTTARKHRNLEQPTIASSIHHAHPECRPNDEFPVPRPSRRSLPSLSMAHQTESQNPTQGCQAQRRMY
jgi:hypothetical protein